MPIKIRPIYKNSLLVSNRASLKRFPNPNRNETINPALKFPFNSRVVFETTQLLKAIEQSIVFPPAISVLKTNVPDRIADLKSIEKTLAQLSADKGYSTEAMIELANKDNLLPYMVGDLVLRESNVFDGFNDLLLRSTFILAQPKYRGTSEENLFVDGSIKASFNKNSERRKFAGVGATRIFRTEKLSRQLLSARLFPNTQIVIIGGGPAGIMTARGLIEHGFDKRNIVVLDAKGEYKGIWNQKNVSEGSKNNPFKFSFIGEPLDAAPGSGETVSNFLDLIIRKDTKGSLPDPVKGNVLAVIPGDLDHTVLYKADDGSIKSINAPIVINAIGNGKPLNPNREGHMTTNTPENAGIRWQTIINEKTAERYRNKRLIFTGLGNSTAEMLMQVRELNKKGYNIDYRVITHYPKEAIFNPEKEVEVNGKKYKVFRDISIPNLTKWEGDLRDAREAYFEALGENKIVSDVKHWDMKDGVFTCEGNEFYRFNCEQLFTLIGYGHKASDLGLMGMHVTDPYLGSIAYDYDGEIQKNPGALGRERVFPGYFGLGSILRSPTNPNAVVMPGIMHRMYDQLFSIIVRAKEYELSLE